MGGVGGGEFDVRKEFPLPLFLAAGDEATEEFFFFVGKATTEIFFLRKFYR
jgi:hypothetical protein